MLLKSDICSRCASALAKTDATRLRARKLTGGAIGIVLGLLGAGLGIYFGANA